MSGYTTIRPLRRPSVPREFRDEHELDVQSVYRSRGMIRGSRVFRAGGTCSCGVTFGTRAGRNTMKRSDVIEAHKDHVVEAWTST